MPDDRQVAAFFDAHAALEHAKQHFKRGGALDDAARAQLVSDHAPILDDGLAEAQAARDVAAEHLRCVVERYAAEDAKRAELAEANRIFRWCELEYEFFAGRRRLLDNIANGDTPVDQVGNGTPEDETVYRLLCDRRAARSRGDTAEMARIEGVVRGLGYTFEDLPHDHVIVRST